MNADAPNAQVVAHRGGAGLADRIDRTSWSRLARVRVRGSHPIPRLEEVLEAFPDARFSLDLKDPRGIGALAAAVSGRKATDRVCVGGSSDGQLADLRAVLPGVATAMGWESTVRLAAATRLRLAPRGVVPADSKHVPLRVGRVPVVIHRLVTAAHALGARLLVWTVDDPAEMAHLWDLGVDAIITDRPDLARQVLVARGTWSAPAGRRGSGR